jgi:DNA anti-recombination protein RmuC
MTIDERLDRLVDRHEALAQSVELLQVAQLETEKRFKETDQRFRDIGEQFRGIGERFRETGEQFQQIAQLFAQSDGFIKSLADIAKRHEDRLDALEGGEPGGR